MQSIHNIVDSLNGSLNALFSSPKLRGSELNCIAVSAYRGQEILPVVMDRNGEGDYVGMDDKFPVRLYHKVSSMVSSIDVKTAMGRSPGNQVNTYNNSMIVFLNRKKTGLLVDELLLLIQSNFPDSLIVEDYAKIKITFNSVILSDPQVYAQEYKSEKYQLKPEYNLFQINYTVEASFKKDCFNKCP